MGDDSDSLKEYAEPAVYWSVRHRIAYDEKYPDSTREATPAGAIDTAQLLSVAVLLGGDERRARLSEVLSIPGPHAALEFLAGQYGDFLHDVEIYLPHSSLYRDNEYYPQNLFPTYP